MLITSHSPFPTSQTDLEQPAIEKESSSAQTTTPNEAEHHSTALKTDIKSGLKGLEAMAFKGPSLSVLADEKGLFGKSKASSSHSGYDSSTPASLDDFAVVKHDLNRDNICSGLSCEWLKMKNSGTAMSRINALDYRTPMHESARQRAAGYHEALQQANASGDSHPLLTANKALLRAANLKLSSSPTSTFVSGRRAEGIQEIASAIGKDGRNHLISLRFDNLQGHAVACSAKNGRLNFFDPNKGEFECSKNQVPQLFAALIDQYADDGYYVAAVNLFKVK